MSREVPLRRSLVLRLFALVAVVALASVVATAWLTVHTTAVGIHEQRGEALQADARIADALTGYAATHRSWAGADTLVARLSDSTGHRITLVDAGGTVLADSSTSGAPLPARDSATIDPLDVGPAADIALAAPSPSPAECTEGAPCPVGPATYLGPPPGDAPIDPRAIGPFELTAAEQAESQGLTERVAACLRTQTGTRVTVAVSPTGRASLVAPDLLQTPSACDVRAVAAPFPSEVKPLATLQRLVDSCLRRRDGPAVTLGPDLGWVQQAPRATSTDTVITACVTAGRREQLTSYVAPAARLYVSRPRQEASTFLDLSAGNRWRIAEVALLVLAVSLGFAAIAGRQLVRPLGLLATAARRVREGDLSARADVRARDEIGSVAAAFNTMAERRERAEVLRQAMVGDVAHELRNPISTIRGSLEAAQDGLVPTDAALVESLLEETLLLQHVVEDLRDLAAADAGDLRLTREPVPVADLFTAVTAAHQRDADAAGVTLTADAEDLLTVDGDPLRLRQLVGNLVGNAVRHTPAGGTVTLSARNEADEVVLAVADTGEGIAATDLAQVFERFWRADPSRARASGGSGLGLAIVRQLAQAHGGDVFVSSTVGAGSTFEVRLPLRA